MEALGALEAAALGQQRVGEAEHALHRAPARHSLAAARVQRRRAAVQVWRQRALQRVAAQGAARVRGGEGEGGALLGPGPELGTVRVGERAHGVGGRREARPFGAGFGCPGRKARARAGSVRLRHLVRHAEPHTVYVRPDAGQVQHASRALGTSKQGPTSARAAAGRGLCEEAC